MKLGYYVLFFMVFLLPIVILLTYGSKSFEQNASGIEIEFIETQKKETLDIKLDIDDIIFQIQLISKNLLQLKDNSTKQPFELWQQIQNINNPYFKQIFLLGNDGKLIYPRLDSNQNQSEIEFIEKTKSLWKNKNFLKQIQVTENNKEETIQTFANNDFYRLNQKQLEVIDTPEGLYPYYSDTNFNIIYWNKISDRFIIGVDLNVAYLKAKIINRLSQIKLSKALIQLLDDNQKIVFQSGNLSLKLQNCHSHQEYLNAPFKNWQIVHMEPLPENLANIKSSFQTSLYTNLVIISLLFILCGAIAYILMIKEARLIQKKMNFITEVSHELKTPLTNIRLYAELLDRKTSSNDHKSKGYIQILLQETQRLSRMIHNVLTFRRLNSKKFELKIKSINANEIVEQCLKTFEPFLLAKGFEIVRKYELNKNILCDQDSLEQILFNLISNVEKYALEGKYICLRTYELKEKAFIECIDRGLPLDHQIAKLIFQPFYRAHKDLSHGAGGTGIGLTISKELSILNNGDLTCEPISSGNTFKLQLEIAKDLP